MKPLRCVLVSVALVGLCFGCGGGTGSSSDGGTGSNGGGSGGGGSGGCVPTSCAAAGADCGSIPDGCGGTIGCGGCTAPQTCGGAGTPNVCGCHRLTCAEADANCGVLDDGCGGTVDCGACSGAQACGGSGTPHVCGAHQVIDFDTLTGGAEVSMQYAPAVIFSGDPGKPVTIYSSSGCKQSPPNFICADACVGNIYVDFQPAARNLSFRALGVNSSGVIAHWAITTVSGKVEGDVVSTGGSATCNADTGTDLSSHGAVTRLEITAITDGYGLGFDDFTFDAP